MNAQRLEGDFLICNSGRLETEGANLGGVD
jgi:hypothetical protein